MTRLTLSKYFKYISSTLQPPQKEFLVGKDNAQILRNSVLLVDFIAGILKLCVVLRGCVWGGAKTITVLGMWTPY